MCVFIHEDQKKVSDFYDTRGTGSYELPDMCTGNQTLTTLNCLVTSSAPEFARHAKFMAMMFIRCIEYVKLDSGEMCIEDRHLRVVSIVGIVGKAVILNEIHVGNEHKTPNSPEDWRCSCMPPFLAQHKLD